MMHVYAVGHLKEGKAGVQISAELRAGVGPASYSDFIALYFSDEDSCSPVLTIAVS